MKIITAIIAFLLLNSCAPKIKKADVPASVKTALETSFPEAKHVKWTKEGDDEFEAEFKVAGKEMSANFTAHGEWKSTETEIEKSKLPQVVREVLAKEFEGFVIKEAEEVLLPQKPLAYEVEVKKGQIKYEIVLAPDGTIISRDDRPEQKSGIALLKKTVLGGEGGWDYLLADAESRRLYVSHRDQVEILNLDTHEKIGAIAGQGIHGIAIASGTGRGVITNGRSSTATIFDTRTLKPIKELTTGKNPDALLYDSFSKRIFIFNHTGGSATVIDIEAATVTGTVDLAGDGVEAGASDEKGTIFVNLEDSHEIVSFDAMTLKVKTRWKLTPGEEPTGLAIDRKTHRLFSACHNELLIVVNYDNGEIVAQVPIGKGVDGAVFDAETSVIATSNGEGSITLIKEESASKFDVLETIPSERGARTITLDTKTHHLFVSAAQYGERPAPTTENPEPRAPVLPGTFMILEFGTK